MNTTLNSKLGYNLDAWDGYVAAHETLLMTAYQLQNAWWFWLAIPTTLGTVI